MSILKQDFKTNTPTWLAMYLSFSYNKEAYFSQINEAS